MTTPDPAAIARRLHPWHKAALLALPLHSMRKDKRVVGTCYRDELVEAELIIRWGDAFGLTPLGLAIRAALLAMKAPDHG